MAKRIIEAPKDLFVVIFPCGAYRCCRTRDGATSTGNEIAKDGTCCNRGHDSYEVHTYRPYPEGRSCTAFRSRVRGDLRLV